MANFDLTILPLHRQAGIDQPALIGLHAAAPPRRAARGRKADQLILLLSFSGAPPFTDDRLTELLERLEKGFYDTPGSLTSASRELIEELNSLILNINLRGAGGRPQISGSISVLVVRNEDLYLAQSGPGHLFVLTPRKVDYIHDKQAAGRGLGVSRTPAIHYAQIPLLSGYRLLFTPEIPETWTAETFQLAHNQALPVAHRRFMEHAGEDVAAALVDILPGDGAVTLVSASGSLPRREPRPAAERAAVPPAEPLPEHDREAAPVQPSEPQQPASQERSVRAEAGMAARGLADTDTPHRPQEIINDDMPEIQRPERTVRPARRKIALPDLAPGLLSGLRKSRAFSARAFRGITEFFQRVLPWDEMAQIPSSYAAFIAVAVPLIVITVAALVYVQRGQTQQFDYYLGQAQQQAQTAQAAEDVNLEHQSWQNALSFLDSAEAYFTTEESNTLRVQVVRALDELDGVTRLEFNPAIAGSMASSIRIRQMFATSNEIYMLDAEHDQIYRAQLIGDRYEMDADFNCRKGRYGSLNVEGLIDMAPLPTNADGAELVAIDSGGNLLYCYPDRPPVAIPLVPPDNYFSEDLVGISLEDEKLYILDKGRNMVWFYLPSDENFQFREAPYFFFQDEVPDMLNVLDFAVDREQLYLLYNGTWETTTCTYSTLEEALTTCTEPENYTDTRPGRESGTTIEDAIFVQVQHTQPPEPSLYYLDPINRSIYHFSLRLNLVQQYRPQIDFEEGPITAFAISPSRHLFIALDNKVFISALP